MEASWGHLRPFEAKDKLWVSKFIFFHADSGNGLKHNFEAVFEANLRLFYYLKAYLKGFQTTDWAEILRGWLFLRLGFHEHVFEAKIEIHKKTNDFQSIQVPFTKKSFSL